MISLLTPVMGLFLFQVGSQPAQMPTQTSPDQILQGVRKAFLEVVTKLKRPRTRAEYKAYMEKINKARELQKKAATEALKKNGKLLSQGEGLRVRSELQLMMGEFQKAIDSLESYLSTLEDKKSPKAVETLVKLAYYTFNVGKKKGDAKKYLDRIDADSVPSSVAQLYRSTKADFDRFKKVAAMYGKRPPSITAQKILDPSREEGDPASFSLDNYLGKVVLIDFWATWCPPCRGVIPSLIEMQKEKGKDLAVIGVTRFYGRGMDFSDPKSTIPHGGKSVNGLSPEDELEVNKAFMKRFGVNYPIVFSKDAGKDYMVRGIPTLFVIGRDGKVIGHVVGGGEANHKKVEEWVEKALKAKKASD